LKQAGNKVVRGNSRGGNQCALRKWDAQHGCLGGAYKLAMFAGQRISERAIRAGIIGREKRTDDELPRLNGFNRASYSGTIPQYSCPIGVG
jgi:hypothetical protein